jgi:hypothetical protein
VRLGDALHLAPFTTTFTRCIPGFGVPAGKAREILMIRRPESHPRTTTGSRAANQGPRCAPHRIPGALRSLDEGSGGPWTSMVETWPITSGNRRCVAPSVDSWRQSSFFVLAPETVPAEAFGSRAGG